MIIDSFHAAYLSWDRTNNLATSQLNTERYFDYGEFSLEEFYNLILETDRELKTKNLHQKTTIGLEIDKNPFFLSGEEFQALNNSSFFSSPYIPRDLISKKNYLGLFIEHEIIIGDRLFVNFEGTLDLVISDIADLPELPSVEPVENNNFFPEISLDYELTNNIFLFTTVSYIAQPVEGKDIDDNPFDSEIYKGLELGIETQLNDNWLATLSFYHETQNNITIANPNQPDFQLQINEQTSNSWTGEVRGEIIPGWWVYGFYTYTDATISEDEVITVGSSVIGVARHSGAFWTSYEITQGVWKGFGFGSGITSFGNSENNSVLPIYLETDLAIFYSQNDFKAAISIQNLFNVGVDDEEVTERSLLGTVWFQF